MIGDCVICDSDYRQWYDVCEEESEINGFVADLLLKSSQNPYRPPILIEIAVTHKCTQEKIEFGLRIIEINIKSEDDIVSIIQNEIIEGKNSENYFSKENNILFYNFSKSYPIEPSDIKFTSPATNDSFMLRPGNLSRGDFLAMERALSITTKWRNSHARE